MNGNMEEQMLYDRVPPQNLEAEQAVLGAILLETEALVASMERLKSEDFYSVAHQRIFDVMVSLNDDNEPIDLITLASRLQDLGQMEEVGESFI